VEEEEGGNDEDDRIPLLFVDVNLGAEGSERIVVYEGETAQYLAHKFCEEHRKTVINDPS